MAKRAAQPIPNGYSAHRKRQRRRILTASERLFNDRGIDRVTMADITSASGVQPSTLYQYFSSKDDIVWEILAAVLQEASASANVSIAGATTGLNRITRLLEFMTDELSKNQARVRFMAQFDAMYARHWPVERLLELEGQVVGQGFEVFSDLIREGIADGSLRPDLDPDLTMHAVMNTVMATQRRLASLGNKVELEYGQPIDRLFRETIRVILNGLRADGEAPKSPKTPKARESETRKRSA